MSTADRIAELDHQLAAERAKVALAVKAFESMRVIYENREMSTLMVASEMLAVSMAALTVLQSADALADIRREVARECEEILCALLAAQKTELNGNPLTDGRYQGIRRCIYAIRAKFGVTE